MTIMTREHLCPHLSLALRHPLGTYHYHLLQLHHPILHPLGKGDNQWICHGPHHPSHHRPRQLKNQKGMRLLIAMIPTTMNPLVLLLRLLHLHLGFLRRRHTRHLLLNETNPGVAPVDNLWMPLDLQPVGAQWNKADRLLNLLLEMLI